MPIPGCCASEAECDDNDACTQDACVDAQCTHVALDCFTDNQCMLDSCDHVLGCVHTPLAGEPCLTDVGSGICDSLGNCEVAD